MVDLDAIPDASAARLHHAALLYHDPDLLAARLAAFARSAAQDEQPVLAILPPGSLELAGRGLRASGADLHLHDMAVVGVNPGRLLPVIDAWLTEIARPARVIAEPVWSERQPVEVVECLRHEAALNLVLADRPVNVLCAYDAAGLDDDVLAGAEMTHPWLIDDAGPRPSPRYGDPEGLAAGGLWPLADPVEPISELDFDGDLRALRRAVAADPLAAALEPDRRDDLVFAVNEAAINAIRHSDGACRARLWRDGDRLVAEVRTNTPILDVFVGRRTPDPGQAGGRGLWLVNQVCDLVELRSDSDGARLRLHLRDPGSDRDEGGCDGR